MTAIEFNHVGKQYRLGLVGTGTLSQDLNRWWQTAVLHHEDPYLKIGDVNDRAAKANSDFVWALRDIDFKVEEGDVVGIIGKNGAGKSTLLKLLSRVTTPTVGTINYRGRLAALLEVGTGFHGEMTGRENIFMNGAILGMTRQEIQSKLDEIIDFSGCEKYIDTPVKRYSSGMTVRLGFAVAAFLEPEILIVDEVLAVGDAEFQKKAIGKMKDVSQGEGRTVLFVSHNMASIRQLCKKGIVLDKGMVRYNGAVNEAVDMYLSEQFKTENVIASNVNYIMPYVKLSNLLINNQSLNPVYLKKSENTLNVIWEGELYEPAKVAFEFRLKDKNDVPILFYSPSYFNGHCENLHSGQFHLEFHVPLPKGLAEGVYYGTLALTEPHKKYHIELRRAVELRCEGVADFSGHVYSLTNEDGYMMLYEK